VLCSNAGGDVRGRQTNFSVEVSKLELTKINRSTGQLSDRVGTNTGYRIFVQSVANPSRRLTVRCKNVITDV
jgi:hypothetical protein